MEPAFRRHCNSWVAPGIYEHIVVIHLKTTVNVIGISIPWMRQIRSIKRSKLQELGGRSTVRQLDSYHTIVQDSSFIQSIHLPLKISSGNLAPFVYIVTYPNYKLAWYSSKEIKAKLKEVQSNSRETFELTSGAFLKEHEHKKALH